MANSIVLTTLATMTSFSPLPTFSSLSSAALSLPLSSQTVSLSSQALTSSVSSDSIASLIPSSSSSFSSISTSVSSKALSTTTTLPPRLATSSATQTNHTPFPSKFSSLNSGSSNASVTMPVAWIVVIVIFSIAIIILSFGVYKARRRPTGVEAELAMAPQNTPRPWSNMDVTPGLIRRTTTSRLREDWQQWITKPPPLRSGLRRRDSAVLFGAGWGSRNSCEPLLTAHEVEASGVLESTDISDPPPAYTPRRV